MNKVLFLILIYLFSITIISCSSSDDGSSTTTALIWDQGSWDSHNWQ